MQAAAADTARLWRCLRTRGQGNASVLARAGRRASHLDARVPHQAQRSQNEYHRAEGWWGYFFVL
eukprot:7095043-Pyramimonas_sp.AAC.1